MWRRQRLLPQQRLRAVPRHSIGCSRWARRREEGKTHSSWSWSRLAISLGSWARRLRSSHLHGAGPAPGRGACQVRRASGVGTAGASGLSLAREGEQGPKPPSPRRRPRSERNGEARARRRGDGEPSARCCNSNTSLHFDHRIPQKRLGIQRRKKCCPADGRDAASEGGGAARALCRVQTIGMRGPSARPRALTVAGGFSLLRSPEGLWRCCSNKPT